MKKILNFEELIKLIIVTKNTNLSDFLQLNLHVLDNEEAKNNRNKQKITLDFDNLDINFEEDFPLVNEINIENGFLAYKEIDIGIDDGYIVKIE